MANEHRDVRYKALAKIKKIDIVVLAIFQILFIVLFGLFADINRKHDSHEVPKLYSSNCIYIFQNYLL